MSALKPKSAEPLSQAINKVTLAHSKIKDGVAHHAMNSTERRNAQRQQLAATHMAKDLLEQDVEK